jgi:hypothetical protein
MLVTLARQIELHYRLFKARNNPQKLELQNIYLERSRMGMPPRGIVKAILEALRGGRNIDALNMAASVDFNHFVNVNGQRFLDFTPGEKLAVLEARHIALTTPQAVVSLTRAVDHIVQNKIPGALVECGVYMGGSIVAVLRALMLQGVTDRDIYLFDTSKACPSRMRTTFFILATRRAICLASSAARATSQIGCGRIWKA